MPEMYNRFRYLMLLYLLFPFSGIAQDYLTLWNSAVDQLQQKNYHQALQAFELYAETHPGEAAAWTYIGICHFQLHHLALAEENLFKAFQTNDEPPPEVYQYLGAVFHAKLDFLKAAGYYKSFLRKCESGHPAKPVVKQSLLQCSTGIKVSRARSLGKVRNLDTLINSTADDFRPLLPPNKSGQLYFSSNRHPQYSKSLPTASYDIFVSTEGSRPQRYCMYVNSAENEIALDFNREGTLLYFFRGATTDKGDILMDSLTNDPQQPNLFSPVYECPVLYQQGDFDLFLFSDTLIIFSSNRLGGYGGMDLYYTTRNSQGWSAPENMGPVINTAFNEVSPYLARDGRTLYFSTNHPRRSIGGYDIVRSVFLDHTLKWSPPENLGIPFNSASDDGHLILTSDGTSAYFDSSRKQGFGGRDLYTGLFSSPRPEQLHVSKPSTFYKAQQAGKGPAGNHSSISVPDGIQRSFSIEVRPLYYPAPQMPLTDESYDQLEELINWLVQYPGLKVTFAIHWDPSDDEATARQMVQQQLRSFLKDNNVPIKNYRFRNPGDKYATADKSTNRRIDIFLANPDILPAEVMYTDIKSPLFFHKANTGFYYQLQVPINKDEMIDGLFSRYQDGVLVNHPDTGVSYFTFGNYLTWLSAIEAKKDMEQAGISKVLIAPYINGWEISEAEARKFLDAYPDLANYLNK